MNSVSAYEISPNLQVKGFVSQGITLTDHNNQNGNSEDISTHPIEAGVNLYWQANDNLNFAAQALYSKYGNREKASIELDYVFGRYLFFPQENVQIGVELGRLKTEFGLYNAVRDVPILRPGVNVPDSVYNTSIRGLYFTVDGAKISTQWDTDMSTWKASIYAGERVSDKKSFESFFFRKDLDSDFKTYSRKGGAVFAEFDFEYPLELGVSYMNIKSKLEGGGSRFEFEFDTFVYSLKTEVENFSFTAEYNAIQYKTKDIFLQNFGATSALAPYIASEDKTGDDAYGYYLQAEYSLLPNFSWLVRYEEQLLLAKEEDIEGYKFVGYISDGFQFYSKSWYTGFSWLISNSYLVSFEYGSHEGTSILSSIDNPDSAQLKKNWHSVRALVSYHF